MYKRTTSIWCLSVWQHNSCNDDGMKICCSTWINQLKRSHVWTSLLEIWEITERVQASSSFYSNPPSMFHSGATCFCGTLLTETPKLQWQMLNPMMLSSAILEWWAPECNRFSVGSLDSSLNWPGHFWIIWLTDKQKHMNYQWVLAERLHQVWLDSFLHHPANRKKRCQEKRNLLGGCNEASSLRYASSPNNCGKNISRSVPVKNNLFTKRVHGQWDGWSSYVKLLNQMILLILHLQTLTVHTRTQGCH